MPKFALIFGVLGAWFVLLIVGGLVYRLRLERALRRRLAAWADGEGLRIQRVHRVAPILLPGPIRSAARALPGALAFFHVHATDADGRSRSGFVGLPFYPGKFAPRPLVHLEPMGPGFDAPDRFIPETSQDARP